VSAPEAFALSEVLGALSYALDITEGEPPGHAVRTLSIGMRLAEQLGLGDDVRSALFYALLPKDPGCSSNASRLSSLFHADDQSAKRAMKRVDWSRSDGSGYHRGLAAFDLSRPARVLAVADVFEALTAERPYRTAMPVDEALAVIGEMRGSALCPAAVAGLEDALAGPRFVATLSVDEGVRPAVRRPA
jgi:hypothetical protein